jgi:outer membrane protein OmpA-like peptidoglycan-associated protein
MFCNRSALFLSALSLMAISTIFSGCCSNRTTTGMSVSEPPAVEYAVGSKIDLENIQFDTGKSTIKPESEAVLQRLLKIMQDNPTMTISMTGHTDSAGDANANLQLSKDRSTAVYDWLVGKGIAANRMTHEGKGAAEPIADNGTPEGRSKNRRIEFQITGK